MGGHNLTKLIRAPSNEMDRPECAWSGDLTHCDTACPNEQCHMGENSKWATQTCTRHLGGHNLEKLIWVPSNKTTRLERAQSGDLPRHDMARPTERCHKGENGKWATQTCTRHLGGHNLAKLIRVPLNETARTECTQSGDLTWRDIAHSIERCHKGENGKWAS